MRIHSFITIGAMALVIVWLMGIHVYLAIHDAEPTVMTYDEYLRIS